MSYDGGPHKKIHQLFPVSVWEYKLDEDDMWMSEQALEFCKTLEMNMYNFPAGVRTSRGNIHKDPEMEPLMGFFADALDEIRCAQALQCHELKISLSWANLAPRGSNTGHPIHRHNYSYLSGVYYFTDGAPTTFWDPLNIRNEDTLEIIRDHINPTREIITAEPGKLLVFPGWLKHQSGPHNGSEDRWSMSFNSLPNGAVNAGPQGIPMANITVN